MNFVPVSIDFLIPLSFLTFRPDTNENMSISYQWPSSWSIKFLSELIQPLIDYNIIQSVYEKNQERDINQPHFETEMRV